MGSIGGSIPEFDGIATTARMAEVLGASALPARTMLVTDAAVRDGLLRDPHIRKTLEVAEQTDTIVSSVGTPGREHNSTSPGYLSDDDLEYIREQGAVGDIYAAPTSRSTAPPVPLEMNDRSMAWRKSSTGWPTCRRHPHRGELETEKPVANIGAARSSLLNVLITDDRQRCASILEDEDQPSRHGAKAGLRQESKLRHLGVARIRSGVPVRTAASGQDLDLTHLVASALSRINSTCCSY